MVRVKGESFTYVPKPPPKLRQILPALSTSPEPDDDDDCVILNDPPAQVPRSQGAIRDGCAKKRPTQDQPKPNQVHYVPTRTKAFLYTKPRSDLQSSMVSTTSTSTSIAKPRPVFKKMVPQVIEAPSMPSKGKKKKPLASRALLTARLGLSIGQANNIKKKVVPGGGSDTRTPVKKQRVEPLGAGVTLTPVKRYRTDTVPGRTQAYNTVQSTKTDVRAPVRPKAAPKSVRTPVKKQKTEASGRSGRQEARTPNKIRARSEADEEEETPAPAPVSKPRRRIPPGERELHRKPVKKQTKPTITKKSTARKAKPKKKLAEEVEVDEPEQEVDVSSYEVEHIVSHRKTDGHLEYETKWLNYPSSENTYEIESRMLSLAPLCKYWNKKDSRQLQVHRKGITIANELQGYSVRFLQHDDIEMHTFLANVICPRYSWHFMVEYYVGRYERETDLNEYNSRLRKLIPSLEFYPYLEVVNERDLARPPPLDRMVFTNRMEPMICRSEESIGYQNKKSRRSSTSNGRKSKLAMKSMRKKIQPLTADSVTDSMILRETVELAREWDMGAGAQYLKEEVVEEAVEENWRGEEGPCWESEPHMVSNEKVVLHRRKAMTVSYDMEQNTMNRQNFAIMEEEDEDIKLFNVHVDPEQPPYDESEIAGRGFDLPVTSTQSTWLIKSDVQDNRGTSSDVFLNREEFPSTSAMKQQKDPMIAANQENTVIKEETYFSCEEPRDEIGGELGEGQSSTGEVLVDKQPGIYMEDDQVHIEPNELLESIDGDDDGLRLDQENHGEEIMEEYIEYQDDEEIDQGDPMVYQQGEHQYMFQEQFPEEEPVPEDEFAEPPIYDPAKLLELQDKEAKLRKSEPNLMQRIPKGTERRKMQRFEESIAPSDSEHEMEHEVVEGHDGSESPRGMGLELNTTLPKLKDLASDSRASLCLERSDVYAWHLKTMRKIPSATWIMPILGKVVSQNEALACLREETELIAFNCFINIPDSRECLDRRSYLDFAMYLEHSCDPNCEVLLREDEGYLVVRAARDIAEDEHLTIDKYGWLVNYENELIRIGDRSINEDGVQTLDTHIQLLDKRTDHVLCRCNANQEFCRLILWKEKLKNVGGRTSTSGTDGKGKLERMAKIDMDYFKGMEIVVGEHPKHQNQNNQDGRMD